MHSPRAFFFIVNCMIPKMLTSAHIVNSAHQLAGLCACGLYRCMESFLIYTVNSNAQSK